MSFYVKILLLVAFTALCVASADAQGTPSHFKGKRPSKGCGYKKIEITFSYAPPSADSISPPTADIKDAPIATPIVRSFSLYPAGQPTAPTIGKATTNAMLMDKAGGNTRVANAAINIKFGGGDYSGWLNAAGNLFYDFSGADAAVRGDASITGGTEDFLGAAGTFSSEIIGGVGTTTVKLQVPGKECFDSGYWSIPK